jgi:hypothetical protein
MTQHIQLPDQLYQQAQQRAIQAGYPSVDEYIAEIVESDVSIASENHDHFFTAEVIADLDRIHAEIQAGAKTYTQAEVDERFRQKSGKWRESPEN